MPRYQVCHNKFLIGALCLLFSTLSMAEKLFSTTSSSAQRFSDEPEFLPVDQAFKLIASANRDELHLKWHIADGYYLYQHRTTLTYLDKTQSKLPLQFPQGIDRHDEYFGEITAFYGGLELIVPLKPSVTSERQGQSLQLVYQGCADAGLCYPPQKMQVLVEANGNVLLSKTN